mmetsp:Transcript_109132/g.308553  ORF Transcript_109132/g.308553 Transcript_109132/m.308553 type:complete len:353 (-) Transcript_109132:60-1118(-)
MWRTHLPLAARAPCLALLAALLAPAPEAARLSADAEEYLEGAARASHAAAAIPWDELELEMAVSQTKKSQACWLLSILESLRYNGHFEELFAQDYIEVEEGTGDGQYTWKTKAGHAGKLKIYDWNYRGVYQQVLETIFSLQFTGDAHGSGKKFQSSLGPSPKNGVSGRADALQRALSFVDPDITVTGSLKPITLGWDSDDLEAFFRPNLDPGTVVVFQLDKTGKNGQGHAIAVRKVKKLVGGAWKLITYNQQVYVDMVDSYTIRKQDPVCKSRLRDTCNSVWRYVITGLPAEVEEPDEEEEDDNDEAQLQAAAPDKQLATKLLAATLGQEDAGTPPPAKKAKLGHAGEEASS